MSVAQSLYEGVALPEGQVGLITYMRTDSLSIASGAVAEARTVIGQRFGAEFVPDKPNAFRNRSRGAQEAHEAIRPSSFARTPDSMRAHLKPDEFRLYELIWKRAIASQMAPARFDQVGVDVEAGRYTLHAGARKRVFDGYQAVYVEGKDDEEDERLAVLPDLRDGEPLDLAGVAAEQHFTQPPPRYTEATLIKALEEHGIGRPSTYAPTIETIRARGYVTIKERRLFPEESAFRVTDLLVEHFPEVVDIEFTARMEEQLDEVAAGDQRMGADGARLLGSLQRQDRRGARQHRQAGRADRHRLPGQRRPAGQALRPQRLVPGLQRLPGVQVHGAAPRRGGRGGGAARRGGGVPAVRAGPPGGAHRPLRAVRRLRPLPRLQATSSARRPAAERFGTCPKCGLGTVVTKRARRGRRPFWGCDRYPDCDYSSWTKPGRPEEDGEAPAASGGRAVAEASALSGDAAAALQRFLGHLSSRNSSPGTIREYRRHVAQFFGFLEARAASTGRRPTGPRCAPTSARWPSAASPPRRSAASWPRSAPSTATRPDRAGSTAIRSPACARRSAPAACRACCPSTAPRAWSRPPPPSSRQPGDAGAIPRSRTPPRAATPRCSSCCTRPGCGSASSPRSRWTALDLDRRRLRVIGKGSKERELLFGEHAARALRAYLASGRPTLAARGHARRARRSS